MQVKFTNTFTLRRVPKSQGNILLVFENDDLIQQRFAVDKLVKC